METSMSEKSYRISGKVIESESQVGIPDLRVEAWDKDFIIDDFLCAAHTDASGIFQIEFTESSYKEWFFDRRPDLYFKLYRDEELIVSTEASVYWNIDSDFKEITIEVDTNAITTEPGQAATLQQLLKLLSEIDVMLWPIKINSYGEHVHKLHLVLAGLGYAIPPRELMKEVFGVGTQWLIKQIQKKYKLEITECFDSPTKKALEEALMDAFTPYHVVEGRALLNNGLSASDVTLRLYLHGIGGPSTNAFGECKTDSHGFYFLTYYPQDKAVNIEIRALSNEGLEVPLTSIKFNSAKYEVINLVIPAKDFYPLEPHSEYQQLIHDLSVPLGNWRRLAEIRETPEQRDITALHQTTGWDARLIALASIAVKNSEEIANDSTVADSARLSPAFLYALSRTGLPYDKNLFGQISLKTVEDALAISVEVGIVSQQEIEGAIHTFGRFNEITRRNTKSPTGLSSFGDLLNDRANPDVPGEERLTDEEKLKFEQLYFSSTWMGDELWSKAADLGIAQDKINGLKLQGKLAYLTQDNAVLIQYLQARINTLGNLADLVSLGLYQSASWQLLIRNIATLNNISLEALIPSGYLGETIDDRLYAYTADLAEKVRFSFPTNVIGQYIARGDEPGGLNLGDDHERLQPMVCSFLDNAAKLDFQFGRMHVEAFIENNKGILFEGIDIESRAIIIDITKKIHRLYQIAPDDHALITLYKLGFTSAHEIASISRQRFIENFGLKFNAQSVALSKTRALEIYNRSQQLSAITFSMVTTMGYLASSPWIFGISGIPKRRNDDIEKLKDNLKDYPTTWSLFGSQDFCECQHCRSVLSPAAYFADLLKFLEPNTNEWESTMENWRDTHNCALYPFQNITAWHNFRDEWYHKHPDLPIPMDLTPYDILTERRPDLPYIKLSCENTNTSLPYIDLVNEILEYHVAYGNLNKDAAHDTGTATTPELLAEPQNVIVGAYKSLNEARYPLTLPFDLWLETVRRFFDHFQTPLGQVLDIFRNTDQLFEPAQEYDRAAIFSEYLGFSPAEYDIFTTLPNPDQWFTLYGFSQGPTEGTVIFQENDQSIDLTTAKALARRLGVTYLELGELVSMGFLTGWKEGMNLILRPPVILKPSDTVCDFGKTKLAYATEDAVETEVYLRINLFVRLWKKLGWLMDDVDQALGVFLPSECRPLSSTKLGEGFKTALVYLAHLKTLDEQLKVGINSRQKLLTLWSALSITGQNPLYKRLFLNPGILNSDPDFDDANGNYLPEDTDKLIKDHLLAVQSALVLTSGEIETILADIDEDYRSAKLSLKIVSLLYRYGLLAKAMKLSITDLIAMKHMSGTDPFKPLTGTILNELAEDYPFSNTLHFIEVTNTVKASGFNIEDMDYLIRHRFDPVGKYRDNTNICLNMVKTLAEGLQRIRDEHAEPEDALIFDDEAIRRELALLVPLKVGETLAVDTFLGMWTGTIEYSATEKSEEKLEPQTFAEEKTIKLAYDEANKVQHLTFSGVLLEKEKSRLINKYNNDLFGKLLVKIQQSAIQYFADYLEAILGKGTFETVFSVISDDLTEKEKQEKIRAKRHLMASSILPKIQQKLARQFVVETLSDNLSFDETVTELLLTEDTVLEEPENMGQPLLEAFKAAVDSGVSVELYDDAGNLSEAKILPDGELKDCEEATEVRLEGYFEVLASGDYRFFVSCGKPDASLNFNLSHLPEPLIQGKTDNDHYEFDNSTKLKAGVPYHYRLSATKPGREAVAIHVMGENLPKGAFNRLKLYPMATVERVRRCYLLLAKTVQFIKTFQFNEREIRYLWTHYPLKKLPTLPDPALTIESMAIAYQQADSELKRIDALEKAKAENPQLAEMVKAASDCTVDLFKQFLVFAEYAAIKRNIADGTDDIIGLFEQANQQQDDIVDLCDSVAQLTRRKLNIVHETAQKLNFKPNNFAQTKDLRRLWDALQQVERIGVPADKIALWSMTVVSSRADYDKKYQVAVDLKHSVKAIYDKETWERIAQPIFDSLRQMQRDALVAYILHHNGFEQMEQLFEYFLIDPGMEPMVQTSRIRLAISSVQTFIQRCLLNLEKYVSPLVINSKQWEWMKHYRVWEANRKIFLYPENWLEPEFRDDKTDLFQALESTLLQGDLSNDSAEDAFYSYLQGLEEIAHLEIKTMCREHKEKAENDIIHVIGRTPNKPYKYFYRRYANNMWTPWESLGIQIESDHVVMSMWRGRLYVFWVTFTPKVKSPTHPSTLDMGIAIPKLQQVLKVQLNWSQYARGQWINCQYNGFENTATAFVKEGKEFIESEVFIHIEKGDSQFGETLTVHVYAENLLGEIIEELELKILETALNEAATAAKNAHEAAELFLTEYDNIIPKAQTANTKTSDARILVIKHAVYLPVYGYKNEFTLIQQAATFAALKTSKLQKTLEDYRQSVYEAKSAAKSVLDLANDFASRQLSKPGVVNDIVNIDAVRLITLAKNSAAKAETAFKNCYGYDGILPYANITVFQVNLFSTKYSFFDNQDCGFDDKKEADDAYKATCIVSEAVIAAQGLAELAKSNADKAFLKVNDAVKIAQTVAGQIIDEQKKYPTPRLSFFLAGRHTPPQIVCNTPPPDLLYSARAEKITLYKCDKSSLVLNAPFIKSTIITNGQVTNSEKTDQSVTILARTDQEDVFLLPCASDNLTGSAADSHKRQYGPFFYKDPDNTFFVETKWVESKSIAHYPDYGLPKTFKFDYIPRLYIERVPIPGDIGGPVMIPDTVEFDSSILRYMVSQRRDWITQPTTLLAFDNGYVWANGGVQIIGAKEAGKFSVGFDRATVIFLVDNNIEQPKFLNVAASSGFNASVMQITKKI